MYNFDPYNVLLSIATNIPVLLMTAFVLQGHIYIYKCNASSKCMNVNVNALLFVVVQGFVWLVAGFRSVSRLQLLMQHLLQPSSQPPSWLHRSRSGGVELRLRAQTGSTPLMRTTRSSCQTPMTRLFTATQPDLFLISERLLSFC